MVSLVASMLRRAARGAGRGIRGAHSRGVLVLLGVLAVVALAVLMRRLARRENATGSAEACAARGKYFDQSQNNGEGKCMEVQNCTKRGGEVRAGLCSTVTMNEAAAVSDAYDIIEGRKCLTRGKFWDPDKRKCMEFKNCDGEVSMETGLCGDGRVYASKSSLGALMQGNTSGVQYPALNAPWCRFTKKGLDTSGRRLCWNSYKFNTKDAETGGYRCASSKDCADRFDAHLASGGAAPAPAGTTSSTPAPAGGATVSKGSDGKKAMRGYATGKSYPGLPETWCKFAKKGVDVDGKPSCWATYPVNTAVPEGSDYKCASAVCRDLLNDFLNKDKWDGKTVSVWSGENFTGERRDHGPTADYVYVGNGTVDSINVPAGLSVKLRKASDTSGHYLGINGPAEIRYLHDIDRVGEGQIVPNGGAVFAYDWGGHANMIRIYKGKLPNKAKTFNAYE